MERQQVHQAFSQIADRFPRAAAIEYGDREVTYGQLESRANNLANFMLGYGCAKGSVVSILAENTVDIVTAMIATLKTGSIFVPLDPALPAKRLRSLIAEVSPQWFVAQSRFLGRLAEPLMDAPEAKLIRLDEGDAQDGDLCPLAHLDEYRTYWNPLPPEVAPDPDGMCYVYFTSGSTGRPKGIAGRLKGITHFIEWEKKTLGLAAGVRVSQLTSPSFDAYLRDIFVPLCTGGTVCAPQGREIVLNPRELIDWVDRKAINLVHCVPSVLRSVLNEELDPARFMSLRFILLAGEALLPSDVKRWTDVYGERVQLVNLYGPSETTMTKFFYFVKPCDKDRRSIPIGKPIEGARAIVVDGKGNVASPGAVGEIYIRTPFRTHGYYNQPDLTKEAFIQNPFNNDPNDIVYKTGDLGRVLEDGNFEFLERRDHQVKIRGGRIEIAEIEGLLRSHEAVKDVAVIDREDTTQNKYLCAYVVLNREVEPASLREYLSDLLPEYAVPSAFVILDLLPRTISGKVDRKALPEPAHSRPSKNYVPPRTPIEEEVAAIWGQLLPVERVGIQDNFFEMGGHSLLATQLISRLRSSFGIEVPFRCLFTAPTLEGVSLAVTQLLVQQQSEQQMARIFAEMRQLSGDDLENNGNGNGNGNGAIALKQTNGFAGDVISLLPQQRAVLESILKKSSQAAAVPEISRRPGGSDTFPLSFAQQRLWFIHQLDPESPAYNIPLAGRLRGALNLLVLRQSLQEIARRHEVLRTRFLMRDRQPVQVTGERDELALPLCDISGLGESEREQLAIKIARQEAGRTFDLERGPVWRASVVRLGEQDHVLLLNIHHIACDGWSVGVLVKEFTALYEQYSQGRESDLPELDVQYADFAVWQREWLQGEVLDHQLSYWKNHLDEAPALELPTDRPRTAAPTHRSEELPFSLPVELTTGLKQLGQREGVTLFMTLLAALEVVLGRYAGKDDVAVGTPIANRNRSETEGLIGFFVNQLVLRTDLSGDPSLRELLGRVRETTLGAYAHQDIPFEKLVEELAPDRRLGRSPLFQVELALQNAPQAALLVPGLTFSAFAADYGVAKFDLTISLSEARQSVLGRAEYATDLFDGVSVERLLRHVRSVLEAMVSDVERRTSGIGLLTAQEQQQLLVEWNDTKAEHQRAACFNELFEARVGLMPDAIAVVFGEEELSYGELNRRANQIGHHLKRLGVSCESRVGLLMERSARTIEAVLGILKSGGVYVPLDPNQPRHRLEFILEDAQTAVLLTESRLAIDLPRNSIKVVCLDSDWESISQEAEWDLGGQHSPDNLAYIIYTSGSTGNPKGVMIRQGSAANYAMALREVVYDGYQGAPLNVSLNAPLVFDASIKQLVQLLFGYRLVLIPEDVRRDGEQMLAYVLRQRLDVLDCTPTHLKVLLAGGLGEVSDPVPRWVLVGGEALDKATWAMLAGEGWRRYFNHYGPTECTINTTICRIDKTASQPRIGRPIANTQVFILDAQLRPSPVGVTGELYVSGEGVARGYVNCADWTAEKFIPNPFSIEPGERMYKSGDLGRCCPDGAIEFVGRADHQVKVRGYRIELQEVEVVLRDHPQVSQAIVIAHQDSSGGQRLIAYLVTRQHSTPSVEELRRSMRERLPDYMLPSTFVFLEKLPLTRNGKIDRNALPVPETIEVAGECKSALSPVEEIIGGIWSAVLGLESVTAEQDFFELGGHSLLATQVISRVREAFDVEVPLKALFERPTVAGLAEAVERERRAGRRAEAPPIEAVGRDRELPLSFAQQRLWFIHQLEPDSAAYNIPHAVRLMGRLQLAALAESLGQIALRHEVLRTRIEQRDGHPHQVIDDAAGVELRVWDLTGLGETEREREAREVARREGARPFNLERGPVWRASVVRLGEQEHVLLLNIHHISSDGWSTGVLVKEFTSLYEQYSSGHQAALPELEVQYADYAAWQREWLQGGVLEQQLSYWRKQLEGAPVLELPTDRPRPAVASHQGAVLPFTLSAELTQQLKQVSRRQGVTMFMTLLAAFQVVLSRYSGQDDVVVGTDVANRNRVETESLIGFFINHLVLRTDLSANPTFKELLSRVRETTLSAYQYQDLPFDKLVEELEPLRGLSHTPIFQVLFVLENMPLQSVELPGLTFEPFPLDISATKYDWVMLLHEHKDGIAGTCLYSTELFDASTIERACLRFQRLLEKIVASPDARLRELEVMADAPEKKGELSRRAKFLQNVKPRTVSLALGSLVNTGYLSSGQRLPLVVTPAVNDIDAVEWAGIEREFIEKNLLKHGAILFRGFNLREPSEFEKFASAICPELFSGYGDLPREAVSGRVYGSTPYPNDQPIMFHNESSHMHSWPLKIWFYCLIAPQQGGETPIVNCRELYREMDPNLIREFSDRRLMYVRNFNNGLDVSWQDFFKTSDRAAVEEFCREAGIICEWMEGNTLRTKKVCQAVAAHPKTGEPVFFNQLQAHHVSCLDPTAREALLNLFGEEGLPRNVYYGDGEPIPDSVVNELQELYEKRAKSFIWQQGDILMVDNMLAAHGRRPFVGPRKIVVAMGEMIGAAL